MNRSVSHIVCSILVLFLSSQGLALAASRDAPTLAEVKKVFESGLSEPISRGKVKIGKIEKVENPTHGEPTSMSRRFDAEVELVFLKTVSLCPAKKPGRLLVADAVNGRSACKSRIYQAGKKLTVIGAVEFEKAKTGWKVVNWSIKARNWDDVMWDGIMKGNPELVRAAIIKGADINAKNKYGVQPLHFALVEKKSNEIVKMLARNGADVNARDGGGWTALIWAIYYNNPELVKALIVKGADVKVEDTKGKTALIYAAEKNNSEIIRRLLNNGADVNAKNSSGVPALVWAAAHGNTEIVKMLLARGARVNAKDNLNRTALDLALSKGYAEIVKLLRERGARESSHGHAAQ